MAKRSGDEGNRVVSVMKQVMVAAVLLALVAGAVFWHRSNVGPDAAAAIGQGPDAVAVEISRAAAGTVAERIEAVGSTLARQAVDVVPLASGRVTEIAFAPGAEVARGDLLVRLDDGAEQAAVAEAEAGLREAGLALERARKLRSNNTVAQATVDELEAAFLGARARLDAVRNDLAERAIRAPFAGVVGMRRVDVGARVDDETVLTTLDDLAEVEIEFSVPEIFFGRVRPDQPVSAASTAFPDRTFEGRIRTIDTRIGEISRAFRVRAVIPNPDRTLPAGMFMHVEVILEERPAVLIPEEAVLAEGEHTFVFTVQDEQARRRAVRLGQRRAGAVEVLDGVAAGEPVVRSGLQRLRDGAAVTIQGGGGGASGGSGGQGA